MVLPLIPIDLFNISVSKHDIAAAVRAPFLTSLETDTE